MIKSIKVTISVFCSSFLALFPLLAKAQIVPCGRKGMPPCELCHIFLLISEVVNFILMYIAPLAGVFVVIGGILILISRGAELAVQGKKMITYAVIGVVIALLAWTIINTIMLAVLDTDEAFPMPWNKLNIKCAIVVISAEEALETSYNLAHGGVSYLPLQYSKNDTNLSFFQFLKNFFNLIKTSYAQVEPRAIQIGDRISYTATYTNISDVDLSNLVISIDYDESQMSGSISNTDAQGADAEETDDGNQIIWNIDNLDSGESITVSFEFILSTDISNFLGESQDNSDSFFVRIFKKLFKPLNKTVSAQQNIATVHYYNLVSITSNEAVSESLNDPLEITIPLGIFAERQYYQTETRGLGWIDARDELRYNIDYYNPTEFRFNDIVIISDYDQDYITITNIDGGGIDNGDRIVWHIGDLPEGYPSQENPGCIGYDFTIKQSSSDQGMNVPNMFYILSEGGLLETNNDAFRLGPDY